VTKVICDRTKCFYCDEDTGECELQHIALREDGTCACYRDYESEIANKKAINYAREKLSSTCRDLVGEVFSALKVANYKDIEITRVLSVFWEKADGFLGVLQTAKVVAYNVRIPHPFFIAQAIRLLKQKHLKFNAANLEKIYRERNPIGDIYSETFNGFEA